MLGIIAAMQIEVDAILKVMENSELENYKNTDFYKGSLAGKDVVICKSGVGKCAASITTTLLIEHYDITGIINIGTAGGLVDNQKTLDVVVSIKVAQYDIDVVGWSKGFNQDKTCYKANEKYIDVIKNIIQENNDRVWVGNIASGDQFVCRDDQVNYILANYPDAICAEMEAGAVAQTCSYFNIPFVIVRSLSDITLHPSNELTFEEYVEKAAARSAIWCEKFVNAL